MVDASPGEDIPDIYRPEVGDDPYPLYEALRRERPVLHDTRQAADMYPHVRMGRGDRYILSRYDDVVAVLKDHDTFSSQRRAALGDGPQPSREEWRGNLVGDDPPRHTMIRKMVRTALSPRAVRAVEPSIRASAVQLMDSFDDESVDLAQALAVPLPVWMIAFLLGVPEGDMAEFRKWAFAGNAQHWRLWWEEEVGSLPTGDAGEAELEERRTTALEDFYTYFAQAAQERRERPLDDIVSHLVAGQAEVGDDAFTRREMLQVIHLLLLGGNETTANLITLIFNLLADRPDLWEALQRDRSLIPVLIEEVMRWDGPVQSVGRRVVADVTIHGVPIPPESTVLLLLGSANRDERQFDVADQVRLDRHPNSHIGFGHGIHFCVGAPVTRTEVAIVMEEMLDRYRAVERAGPARLAGTAPYGILSESRRLRGYGQLPLRLVRR